MARLDYLRTDLVIAFFADRVEAIFGDERCSWPRQMRTSEIGAALIDRAPFRSWQRVATSKENLHLARICLDVRTPRFAVEQWETILPRIIRDLRVSAIVVRTSLVRPRCANYLFSPPLRILRVNRASDELAFPGLDQLHRGKQLAEYQHAFATADESWRNWLSATEPFRGPNIDILQIEKWPQMSTVDRTGPGSHHWLIDQIIQWQVRLLIVQTPSQSGLRRLRHFAAALVARGGPAVIIEAFPPSQREGFYRSLYADVIHDRPLDWAWQNATSALVDDYRGTFFAGALREEQLRISQIAGLVPAEAYHVLRSELSVAERLRDIVAIDFDPIAAILGGDFVPAKKPARKRSKPALANESSSRGLSRRPSISLQRPHIPGRFRVIPTSATNAAELLNFNHESSFLRIAKHLSNARKGFPASITLDEAFLESVDESAHRFCNCSFWDQQEDQSLREINQASGRFTSGTPYQMGVQIGPKNNNIIVGGEHSFLPEVVKWTPEMKGDFIEIGITGIDFDVIGEAVQKVWLPKDGPTEMVYFAVSPKKEGLCRLRFALYYEQNVIQSFRVAVVVGEDIQDRPASLASALGLSSAGTPDVTWLPMLEFSLASSIDSFASEQADRPSPRALSILVNDWNEQSVITVKGKQGIEVKLSERLPEQVRRLLQTLEEISVDANGGYPFSAANGCSREAAEVMFRSLADHGNQLFAELFSSSSWKMIRTELADSDRTIQISQVLREKVVPWSFVYERRIVPLDGDRNEAGSLVNMPVCFAALPNADGAVPKRVCGENPQCLLNTTGRKPENVICSTHFWGYRHIIEIPPVQVQAQQSTPESTLGIRKKIAVQGDARMVAGFNGSFSSHPAHFQHIEAIAAKVRFKAVREFRKSALLKELNESPIHIAYFFCHSEGGENQGVCRLILQSPDAGAVSESVPWQDIAQIRDGDLWMPPALVFLNGCSTASFSPRALSPFLHAFVDQLGASGMVGTEISVWDVFAAEMAESFLADFFNCMPVGMALLRARRKMLAKRNPLGLVYTLFAWSELQLMQESRPDLGDAAGG